MTHQDELQHLTQVMGVDLGNAFEEISRAFKAIRDSIYELAKTIVKTIREIIGVIFYKSETRKEKIKRIGKEYFLKALNFPRKMFWSIFHHKC